MSADILSELEKTHTSIRFVASEDFSWSPNDSTVFYHATDVSTSNGSWRLLHELGHALLEHKRFAYDLELVRMELAAWEKAVNLQKELELNLIDPDNIIADCMDTYRDWVYARSVCPNCEQTGMQQASQYYRCPGCQSAWRVPTQQGCAIRRTLIDI